MDTNESSISHLYPKRDRTIYEGGEKADKRRAEREALAAARLTAAAAALPAEIRERDLAELVFEDRGFAIGEKTFQALMEAGLLATEDSWFHGEIA